VGEKHGRSAVAFVEEEFCLGKGDRSRKKKKTEKSGFHVSLVVCGGLHHKACSVQYHPGNRSKKVFLLKMNRMKYVITAIACCLFTIVFAQEEHLTIWSEGAYKRIPSDEVLPTTNGITALLIDVTSSVSGIAPSLKNNPHLREVHLFGPDQAALNELLAQPAPALEYVIVKEYKGTTCAVPQSKAEKVFQFSIESEEMIEFSIAPRAYKNLDILGVEAPKLQTWSGKIELDSLGLLDVQCPLMTSFPPLTAPDLVQWSLQCALDHFPPEICSMPLLMFAYFSSSRDCPVEKCYKKVMEGEVLISFTTNAGDEKNEKNWESKYTKQFEQEMQREFEKEGR
jgi:hypothetical protein